MSHNPHTNREQDDCEGAKLSKMVLAGYPRASLENERIAS